MAEGLPWFQGINSGFQLAFQVPEIKGLRNQLGQFTAGANQYGQAVAIAQDIQGEVVQRMRGSFLRPGVSTGRLMRATADPKNRYVPDGWHVAVGIPDFLDKSEAKYWRTIEEGSAEAWRRSFIGMELHGRFGTQLTGEWRTGNWGRYPVAGAPWSRKGGSDGKFRPLGGWFAAHPVIVKHEIQPKYAYQQTFESARERFDHYGRGAGVMALNRVFREGLGQRIVAGPGWTPPGAAEWL